ncbi:MAG: ATP-binding protein [Thermoanaerobaculia bacterium]|nr:ATP-binding protein [Thermoanaerobaculia bacterium]
MIDRLISTRIQERLGRKKAILLLGPRQTGKTTLVKKIMAGYPGGAIYLNADEPFDRQRLTDVSSAQLRQLIGNNQLVVIDEAQRVPNIGLTLKLLVDQLPEKQVLATGSSSLDLANSIHEPLTGRLFVFHLLPVSWQEWATHTGALEANRALEQRLLYGSYPDVLNSPGDETAMLSSIAAGYLYKDIFSFGNIRRPEVLEKLLQALALQMGNEVSYNELANLLKVNKDTVSNYIDMLEKSFIVFRLPPLSRNLRKEIASSRKVYFYDTGIRNMLINNYNPLALRQDVGALWENFLISERKKRNLYSMHLHSAYFWRTHDGQEIDYVEDAHGTLSAFEFKWNAARNAKIPRAFADAYPGATWSVVNPDNFSQFVSDTP